MNYKIFEFKKQDNLSELDYLEQIYKIVKIDETIKFNGKVYKRLRPVNNKVRKYLYHFYCISKDIYNGNILTNDKDNELVNFVCDYKAIIVS